MQELLEKALTDFPLRFGSKPELFSQAPGRINIIGEHTDYTQGYSLPAAINRWTICSWKLRDDDKIRIYSSSIDQTWETSWQGLQEPTNQLWKKYVAGSLITFNPQGSLQGFDLTIYSNLALGKGLSSSASLELALLNGLNKLFAKKFSSLELVKMAQQVEHNYLNLKSGLLDQLACQSCQKESALFIDFATLKTKSVMLHGCFKSYSWVLVDSLIKRELANSKYSERVAECLEIKESIQSLNIDNIKDLNTTHLGSLTSLLSENHLKRATHIISENQRVLLATEHLEQGEVKKLGLLLNDSHQSLSQNYEVSHSHLDYLVEIGLKIDGVMGGRMMGGGFGGCCLFLVENSQLSFFAEKISQQYETFSSLKTIPKSFNFVDGASAFSL